MDNPLEPPDETAPAMTVILHGRRYREDFQRECRDVADALSVALSWLPGHWAAAREAWPARITDRSGNELMSGEAVRERAWGRADW